MTEQERLQAEIEATRAELAETADALATKLDVKAQASKKVHAAGEKVEQRYAHLRDAAPPPVQKALGRTEHVMARAAADKRRVLVVLGGTAVLVLAFRRVQRRRRS